MPRPIPCCLAFFLLLFLAGAAQAREVTLHVDPALKDLGIQATVGLVPDKADDKAEAIVFITHQKAFHGKLYLSCYRDDHAEIARSRFIHVDQPAQAGGHVVFPFDAQTDLTQAASMELFGNSTPKSEVESFGDEAKSIIKELLE